MHQKYKGELLEEDRRTCAKNYLSSLLNGAGIVELNNFLENRHVHDETAESVTDPGRFWTLMEWEFPNLAPLCEHIMLIPASTALLEGYFSQWTFVHSKYRNRLSDVASARLADMHHMGRHFRNGKWTNTVDERRLNRLDIDEEIINDDDSQDSEDQD